MEQVIGAFFTWAVLATLAGATAATIVITELLKGVGFFERIPTRIFSYLVALVVLVTATAFTAEVNASAILLCIINAAVVALAAQGGYSVLAGGLSTSKYADAFEPERIEEELPIKEKAQSEDVKETA